jgi:hypothetical protein
VAVERLEREHVDADAADARRCPREVAIDERFLEADCLEDPIFEIVFSRPLPIALTTLSSATSTLSMPITRPEATRSPTVSSSR